MVFGTLTLISTLFFTLVTAAIPGKLYSDLIYTKYANEAANFPNPPSYPHTTNADGTWAYRGVDWWASSFFPGTLYLLNTRSERCPCQEDVDFLSLARTWSAGIVQLLDGNTAGHDQGFLSYPFVEELILNPNNQTAKDIVNRFADILAVRYSPIVGCTKSWDSSGPDDFLVIIDNMMNLELLFISAQLTGNDTLREIAINHADKTMAHHLRPDGGSYHVVNYNASTGEVTEKHTAQGYATESLWSRGQAWGLYGFAMMYNYTQEIRYLNTAEKMANLFLARLPSSGVPPWDFDAPASTDPPRDTSASSIAANGLLLLSYAAASRHNRAGADYWARKAIKLLSDAIDLAWQPTWEPILSNGTSNKPAGSFNTGLVYGDYYFVKAGNMLLDMGRADCRKHNAADDVEVGARSLAGKHRSLVRRLRSETFARSLVESY